MDRLPLHKASAEWSPRSFGLQFREMPLVRVQSRVGDDEQTYMAESSCEPVSQHPQGLDDLRASPSGFAGWRALVTSYPSNMTARAEAPRGDDPSCFDMLDFVQWTHHEELIIPDIYLIGLRIPPKFKKAGKSQNGPRPKRLGRPIHKSNSA